jgi:aspartate ammonia-lyase
MVNQVAFAVVGNDVTVTMAAEGGQLQLNAFEPVIAHALLQNIDWMTRAFERLATLCIDGIAVDVEHLQAMTSRSVGVVTALTPYLGYAAAAEIAKTALAGAGDIRQLVLATGVLTEEALDALLRPEQLAGISEVPVRVTTT